MRQKKTFITLLVLITVVIIHGAVSWWVGARAEKLSLQQVEYLNQQLKKLSTQHDPSQRVTLRLKTKERGIWSTQRQLILDWYRGVQHHRYVLDDQLQHGPWPWARLRAGQWAPVVAYSELTLSDEDDGALLYQWSQGRHPLKAQTEIDWQGQFNSQWRWAALTAKQAEFQFVLGAGGVDIRGLGQNNYQIKAQAPALTYQRHEGLRLIEPKLQWITTENSSLYDGQMHFSATEFAWLAEPMLQGEALLVEFIQNSDDGLLNFSAQGSAEKVVADRGILLGDFQLRLMLERLGENIGAQAFTLLDSKQYEALWLESLAAHPRYTIEEFIWENEGGSAEFSGFFELSPRLGDELEKATLQVNLPKSVIEAVIKQEKGMKAALLSLLFDTALKEGQQLELITFDGKVIKTYMHYDQAADNYVLNGRTHSKDDLQAILLKWLLWLVT